MNKLRIRDGNKGIAMVIVLTFISLSLIILSAGFFWVTKHAELFNVHQKRLVSYNYLTSATQLALLDIKDGAFSGGSPPVVTSSYIYTVSGEQVTIQIIAEDTSSTPTVFTLRATYSPAGASVKIAEVDIEYFNHSGLGGLVQIVDWRE